MDVNEDFVDIAKGFIDNGVEFLIVGAYALAAQPSCTAGACNANGLCSSVPAPNVTFPH